MHRRDRWRTRSLSGQHTEREASRWWWVSPSPLLTHAAGSSHTSSPRHPAWPRAACNPKPTAFSPFPQSAVKVKTPPQKWDAALWGKDHQQPALLPGNSHRRSSEKSCGVSDLQPLSRRTTDTARPPDQQQPGMQGAAPQLAGSSRSSQAARREAAAAPSTSQSGPAADEKALSVSAGFQTLSRRPGDALKGRGKHSVQPGEARAAGRTARAQPWGRSWMRGGTSRCC